MSVEAIQYVKALFAAEDAPAATSAEKLVLRALALFYDAETGCAFASVGKIAREALVSERTVQRATKALEEKGLVLRHEARRDFDRSQATNEYELPGLKSVAVGLEGRQQAFKVSRSRVAVQLKLPGKACRAAAGALWESLSVSPPPVTTAVTPLKLYSK